jgi:hypothetical protein
MKWTLQINNNVSSCSSYITIPFQIVTSFANLPVFLPVSNNALLKYPRRNFCLLQSILPRWLITSDNLKFIYTYFLFSRRLSKMKAISSPQWFWALYLILLDLIQTQWTAKFVRRRCTIGCMKLVTGIVNYRYEKPELRTCACLRLYIHWVIEEFLDT